MFFLKNYMQNMVETDQQSEIFMQYVFVECPSRRIPKYIETKVLNT